MTPPDRTPGDTARLRAPVVGPPPRIARAIEMIEAESAYSQHRCAPTAEARRLGMHAERLGGAAAVLTRKSTNTLYNRLVGLGQSSPATTGQIDRFIAMARAQRVAKVSVPLGGECRPRRLAALLERAGCQRGYPGAKLWRDATPLPPPSERARRIRVRRVTPPDAALWVDVVAQVWRVFGSRRPWYEARVAAPGWRHYLAWIDDRPVGAGALFIGQAGGPSDPAGVAASTGRGDAPIAGHLVDGVTLKAHRRRGVQSAIIRERIADGLARGCAVFTSETAPPLPRMPLVSFRNLLRQGFQLAYLRYPYNLEL